MSWVGFLECEAVVREFHFYVVISSFCYLHDIVNHTHDVIYINTGYPYYKIIPGTESGSNYQLNWQQTSQPSSKPSSQPPHQTSANQPTNQPMNQTCNHEAKKGIYSKNIYLVLKSIALSVASIVVQLCSN